MHKRMKSPMPVLAILLAAAASCSEAGIQPIDDHQDTVVDDLLQIEGTVCTSDPTEAVFPVKIMLIVDCSGSMQMTDPSSAVQPGRQAAAKKLIDRFKNNPAVSFSVVQFNGKIVVNGSSSSSTSGFTNDVAVLNAALSSLAQADITTDYQGALSTAYEILQRDMFEASPTERVRTKYVVIFVSDGGPNPKCKEGCTNDPPSVPGISMDSWCDLPRDKWCDSFNPTDCQNNMLTWYPAMVEPCKAYNQDSQILQKVAEIMDLGRQYSVGEIRFHTGFLYLPGLDPALQKLFVGIDPAVDVVDCETKLGTFPKIITPECLLRKMADVGNGIFRNFSSGQQIDFLSINYATVARPFGMTSLIASNINSIPYINKLLVDTDGDGLDDETEFAAKLNPLSPDTDGDGYNDKLEYDRRKAGFDPLDPNVPVKKCIEREDLDGDGLNGCEEKILGTDPKIADTDRDRITDGIEFIFGTNPLADDTKQDIDFDGKLSGEEIRIHSSPNTADPEIHAGYRYIYDVRDQGDRPDRRKCYDFSIRHVRLVTTSEKGFAGSLGYNDIILTFGEGPSDDPRDYGAFKAACVRAQYVTPNYKYPADGRVTLEDKDFYPLPTLLKGRADALKDHSKDPCRGAPLP
jgi:hypothetical protein